MPLCGHGTLATAAVVMERLEPNRRQVVFHTQSGPLTVKRVHDRYAMDFPARPSESVPAPELLLQELGVKPLEVTLNVFNYLAVLESADAVRKLAPNLDAFQQMDCLGIIVSARGGEVICRLKGERVELEGSCVFFLEGHAET